MAPIIFLRQSENQIKTLIKNIREITCLKFFITLIIAFILSGCNGDTPKCSSTDTKNLVIDISRKEIEKSLKLDADV